MHNEETKVTPVVKDPAKIKKIWTVAAILAVITTIEFILAGVTEASNFRTAVFIVLTLIKAFYIVYEFMHLGHEKKGLVYSILLPMVFIGWILIVLYNDGVFAL